MRPLDGNVEEGRRSIHRVPQKGRGEASAVDRIRDVVDARGGISAVISGNAVGDYLYLV